jgi:biopolymer transport protein ExbD
MGGVDVGGGEKRPKNSDINMIPFIDLLMVTIAFLLITAVWVTNSRLQTNAEVPGQTGCGDECHAEPVKTLHVHVRDGAFKLVWKQGPLVLSETDVPKKAIELGSGSLTALRYPELIEAVESEWKRSGDHRDPSDRKLDQAVLHTDDRTPFREVVAVLDAVSSTRRDVILNDGSREQMAAFSATFSAR